MISVTGLAKSYGSRPVLDGLHFDARAGEITLIVGANGCGKTTTMRIIAGLSAPDEGTIVVAGHPLGTRRTQALEAMSFLPQSPRFHPDLTVDEILRFYARLRGLPFARAEAVATRWGLADSRAVRSGRLSGGMRQRLALSVLFMPEAPVLVLDEPGLSLDLDWRRVLQSELRSAVRHGRTVLVSTHLLGEWDDSVDRCLVLESGRIGRELPPDRLRDAFTFSLPRPVRVAATEGCGA
jgi:ABC-type multidrug transport system ATPase subunit